MISRHHLAGAAAVLMLAAGAWAAEPELQLDSITVTYPQADRIATATGQGTGIVALASPSFDARFDTLTITGTWSNLTPLIFREARLQVDLLNNRQQVLHTLLAEEIQVFHQGQRSAFTLMPRVAPGEDVAAVRPRISYGSRSYQEEYQRNVPRAWGG